MANLNKLKIRRINQINQTEVLQFLRKFVNPFEPLLQCKLKSANFNESDQLETDEV